MEITGMLLVFLELYCNISEEAIYSVDMVVKGNYFDCNRMEFYQETIKSKMEQFYKMFLRSNYVDAITEYDLIETLLKEVGGKQTAIPKTIFGVMKVLSGEA